MPNAKPTYAILSSIDVRPKVERKGQLDYLSWANAWHLLMQKYPDSTRKVYEDPATGLNFFTDGRTAYVKVGVTVKGVEHIDMLPVMDFRNNAVSVDKMTSTDVNKTIQRATAKAIALHGLGLSLWTGEDVPSEEEKKAPAKKSAVKKAAPQKQEALVEDIMEKAVHHIKGAKDKRKSYDAIVKKYGDQLSDAQQAGLLKFVR
tara:strand:- start:5436 stop:6044 length:609 start_codon:yes stop_codon:yes gene_type:complete